MKWLVLGASPGAPDHCDIEADVVAAAGAGILLRQPDWYFLVESNALMRHMDARLKARADGCKIMVGDNLMKPLSKRQTRFYSQVTGYLNVDEHFDGVIEWYKQNQSIDQLFDDAHKNWQPGRMCHATGGATALQWAVNNGATEVHLVGMEGYNGVQDYFDGQPAFCVAGHFTQTAYAPLIRTIVRLCPDIRFIFYGDLRYSVDGANVTHDSPVKT